MNPKKKRYRYNTRLIKKGVCYDIPEISADLNVHEGTVRGWMRQGLNPIDYRRPFLFRGDSLARFLKRRQEGRKKKCGPDEYYCFCCREPRKAKAGTAHLETLTPKILLIKGKCVVCGTNMNRRGSAKNSAEIEKTFDIKKMGAGRLRDRNRTIDLNQFKKATKGEKDESFKCTKRTAEKGVFRVRERSRREIPGNNIYVSNDNAGGGTGRRAA